MNSKAHFVAFKTLMSFLQIRVFFILFTFHFELLKVYLDREGTKKLYFENFILKILKVRRADAILFILIIPCGSQ